MTTTMLVMTLEMPVTAPAWRLTAERENEPKVQAPTPVFGERADPSKELTGRETKADVLRMAIGKEKDTIAYYTSLKEFVLSAEDVAAIKKILQEEDRHVRILTQSLEQVA